jgi:hypothetical protein
VSRNIATPSSDRISGDFLATEGHGFGLLEPNRYLLLSVYGTEGQRILSGALDLRLSAGIPVILTFGRLIEGQALGYADSCGPRDTA